MTDTNWRNHCKALLSDVISEYLNDDKMTPNDFVEDVKEELDSWMEYHKGQYVKASSIQDKLEQVQNKVAEDPFAGFVTKDIDPRFIPHSSRA